VTGNSLLPHPVFGIVCQIELKLARSTASFQKFFTLFCVILFRTESPTMVSAVVGGTIQAYVLIVNVRNRHTFVAFPAA